MKYIISLCICSVYFSVYSQNTIPKGTRIYVDGIYEESEWKDAQSFLFNQSGKINGKVLAKHDGQNLLLAYLMDDFTDSLLIIPEVLIDTKLNKSKTWQMDDFWFHVSAQDCYAKGKREDYSKCRPDYLEWRASPNYPFGNNYEKIKFFEISIPFNLLEIAVGDRIGICFSVAVFPQEVRLNIPNTAQEDSPETWMGFDIN